MDEKKNILDELKKRQKPTVPEGFFESFFDKLMQKITSTALSNLEETSSVLDDLQKTTKPEIPQGFFEEFSEGIMAETTEDENIVEALQKTTKPEVPEGFFEKFSAEIAAKAQSDNTVQEKPTRIITMKVAGFVSAVAASLLVMFFINQSDTETIDEGSTTTNELAEEVNLAETVTDDEYIAFLDGDDVVDFILENEDIEIGSDEVDIDDLDDEDVFYFLDEDIDDFYYDEL